MAQLAAKQVVFRKSPLKLVLCQIRFPTLMRFSEPSFSAPFADAIRSEYPFPEQENEQALMISPAGVPQGAQPMKPLWRFSDRKKEWSVVLGESALTLEVREYKEFDELVKRFEQLLKAAAERLLVTDRIRLGLRYANEFRFPNAHTGMDWAKLLRRELVGLAGTDVVDGVVRQALQEVHFRAEDGMFVVRHGVLKHQLFGMPSLTIEPPEDRGSFYCLDMDYFDESVKPLNIGKTIEQTVRWHETIYGFFIWSLMPELRKHLEPLDARER